MIFARQNRPSVFGHTSVLLEDSDGNWYYFYWGLGVGPGIGTKKVVFELIDDMSALDSLEGLNKWLEEKSLAGIDTAKSAVYNSATYIEGDFSKSVDVAEWLKNEWYAGGLYHIIQNNCMQVTTKLVVLGNFDGGWWKKPLLNANKGVTAPILADDVVAKIFGNSSFVK